MLLLLRTVPVFLRGNARQQRGTHENGFHECRHLFLVDSPVYLCKIGIDRYSFVAARSSTHGTASQVLLPLGIVPAFFGQSFGIFCSEGRERDMIFLQ